MLYVAEERTAGCRLFHALWPAMANARLPIVDQRVAGTTRSADDADRRWQWAVLPTGVASSVKYRGAAPLGLHEHWHVVSAASEGPSGAVSRGRICEHLLTGEQPRWLQTAHDRVCAARTASQVTHSGLFLWSVVNIVICRYIKFVTWSINRYSSSRPMWTRYRYRHRVFDLMYFYLKSWISGISTT